MIRHNNKHTQISSSHSSLDWFLSHWVHFTVRRFICVYKCVFYVFFCFILHICCTVLFRALWGGPDGIEALKPGP